MPRCGDKYCRKPHVNKQSAANSLQLHAVETSVAWVSGTDWANQAARTKRRSQKLLLRVAKHAAGGAAKGSHKYSIFAPSLYATSQQQLFPHASSGCCCLIPSRRTSFTLHTRRHKPCARDHVLHCIGFVFRLRARGEDSFGLPQDTFSRAKRRASGQGAIRVPPDVSVITRQPSVLLLLTEYL